MKRKFSKLDLLPVLSVLSSVGPIVGDTISELLSADPADLPSREDLAFRLGLGLGAIKVPQVDQQDCVNAADRRALGPFLGGFGFEHRKESSGESRRAKVQIPYNLAMALIILAAVPTFSFRLPSPRGICWGMASHFHGNPTITRMLKKGRRGEDVLALQQRLIELGFLAGRRRRWRSFGVQD